MTYVVKAMIERTKRFDEEANCFVDVEPYMYNPVGSTYTVFIKDLKTIRGVKSRIKKMFFPKDVVEVHICSTVCPTNSVYDKLIEVVKIER